MTRPFMADLDPLFDPNRLIRGRDVVADPKAIPKEPGVYAWFFDQVPPEVPTDGCVVVAGFPLLYVGISPKAPPRPGGAASRESLRSRIKYHLTGNAYGSTLRLSLGCLLGYELRLIASRKTPGTASRMTFGPQEPDLSRWMQDHALVTWKVCDLPWTVEDELIASHWLPLNLRDNGRHPFHPVLTAARQRGKSAARSKPPL